MRKIGWKIMLLVALTALVASGCAKRAPAPPVEPETEVITIMEPICGDPVQDLGMGGWAMNCGQYERAIDLLTCAIESCELTKKELAKAYNWRGLAYLKSDCCELAIADFNEALAMFPMYDAVYQNRSYAYLKCGSPRQAAADKARFSKMVTAAKKAGWKPPKAGFPKGCPPGACVPRFQLVEMTVMRDACEPCDGKVIWEDCRPVTEEALVREKTRPVTEEMLVGEKTRPITEETLVREKTRPFPEIEPENGYFKYWCPDCGPRLDCPTCRPRKYSS
jgi:predicted RNA-binding Zn-ribbon protein involved in translation (DUF1610 family)